MATISNVTEQAARVIPGEKIYVAEDISIPSDLSYVLGCKQIPQRMARFGTGDTSYWDIQIQLSSRELRWERVISFTHSSLQILIPEDFVYEAVQGDFARGFVYECMVAYALLAGLSRFSIGETSDKLSLDFRLVFGNGSHELKRYHSHNDFAGAIFPSSRLKAYTNRAPVP